MTFTIPSVPDSDVDVFESLFAVRVAQATGGISHVVSERPMRQEVVENLGGFAGVVTGCELFFPLVCRLANFNQAYLLNSIFSPCRLDGRVSEIDQVASTFPRLYAVYVLERAYARASQPLPMVTKAIWDRLHTEDLAQQILHTSQFLEKIPEEWGGFQHLFERAFGGPAERQLSEDYAAAGLKTEYDIILPAALILEQGQEQQ